MSEKPIKWDLKRQAEIARKSFEERPEWIKRISYFAGTNTAPVDPKNKEKR